MLDGGQQMIGQHTKEDVGLGSVLEMMKNRPLRQRALDIAKSILDAREQNISAPDLIGRQILPIGFENIAAVEFLGDRLFIREFLPGKILVGGIVGDLVVTHHARIALQQSTDASMDFAFLFQAALGDALLKLGQIRDQFRFLLFSDRAVLVFTAFTAAENVNDVALRLTFDFHASLLLKRITRGGGPVDFLPAIIGLELIEPLVSLRLQSCH